MKSQNTYALRITDLIISFHLYKASIEARQNDDQKITGWI